MTKKIREHKKILSTLLLIVYFLSLSYMTPNIAQAENAAVLTKKTSNVISKKRRLAGLDLETLLHSNEYEELLQNGDISKDEIKHLLKWSTAKQSGISFWTFIKARYRLYRQRVINPFLGGEIMLPELTIGLENDIIKNNKIQ